MRPVLVRGLTLATAHFALTLAAAVWSWSRFMPVRFGSQAPTLADQVFSALSSPLALLLKLAFPDGLQHWSQGLLLIATLAANSWLWGMALAWLLSLARPRS